MSTLNVTALKHESAGVDNLVLDTSGNATFGGIAKVGSLMNPSGAGSAIAMDSAGRVTMPYQPAFQARLTSNNGLNNGSWSTLTGSNWTTDYNAGSNFNTANGTFTAPINGFYCFVGQLWFSGNTGGTYRYVGYRKNGSDRYVSSLHATSGIWNSDNTLSYSFTEYLTAGDSIYMIAYADAASMIIGAGTERTRFSGYLIG